jgi:hypothetical protein
LVTFSPGPIGWLKRGLPVVTSTVISGVTVAINVAAEKGEPWDLFRDRHGDTGRDVALWLGRRHCGLTQAELGQRAGGMAYPAVGQAVRGIERKRQSDRDLARLFDRIERKLVDIAM